MSSCLSVLRLCFCFHQALAIRNVTLFSAVLIMCDGGALYTCFVDVCIRFHHHIPKGSAPYHHAVLSCSTSFLWTTLPVPAKLIWRLGWRLRSSVPSLYSACSRQFVHLWIPVFLVLILLCLSFPGPNVFGIAI